MTTNYDDILKAVRNYNSAVEANKNAIEILEAVKKADLEGYIEPSTLKEAVELLNNSYEHLCYTIKELNIVHASFNY